MKKAKLSSYVIEEIRKMIASGQLKDGQKLPNQNELASALGVSRTSLREALNVLTLTGLLEQKPGVGTVIKSKNASLLADHISFPLISDEKATIELIEARGVIEVGAAKLAALNATQDDIEEMRRIIKSMEQNIKAKKMDDYIADDVAFHYLIAKSSQNRFILHLHATIRGAMEQYMNEAFKVLPWMLERSFDYHQRIYEAIEKRDVHLAEQIMNQHINDIKNAITEYYKSKNLNL